MYFWRGHFRSGFFAIFLIMSFALDFRSFCFWFGLVGLIQKQSNIKQLDKCFINFGLVMASCSNSPVGEHLFFFVFLFQNSNCFRINNKHFNRSQTPAIPLCVCFFLWKKSVSILGRTCLECQQVIRRFAIQPHIHWQSTHFYVDVNFLCVIWISCFFCASNKYSTENNKYYS